MLVFLQLRANLLAQAQHICSCKPSDSKVPYIFNVCQYEEDRSYHDTFTYFSEIMNAIREIIAVLFTKSCVDSQMPFLLMILDV